MVRYGMATVGLGESSVPFDVIKDAEMITFKVKVIDLPGPTRNGILYPLEEMKAAVNREMIQQQLKTGSLYGEHDHPENPENTSRWARIDMNNTSFKWTKLYFEGNALYGEIQTVPINGDLLRKCILAGEYPSFSIRVLGENRVSESGTYAELFNIWLMSIDWVRYPGNPDSFVKDASSFNIMESPLKSGKYNYGLKASGESVLLEKGLMAQGESMIPLGKGRFAIVDQIEEKDLDNLFSLRASSFE